MKSKDSSAQTRAIDALRLSSAESREIHNLLDGQQREITHDQRESDRFTYRTKDGVELRITHPGGTTGCFRVHPRNISNTGIGFLHGAFVHLGADCTVVLEDANGEKVGVRGEVVRCRFVSGCVHDVGIRFLERVEVDRFATPEDQGGSGSGQQHLRSLHWSNPDLRPMIPGYVDQLTKLVSDLARLLGAEGPGTEAVQLSRDIASVAKGYGYPTVAEPALELAAALNSRQPVAAFKPMLLELARLCDSARRGAKAA